MQTTSTFLTLLLLIRNINFYNMPAYVYADIQQYRHVGIIVLYGIIYDRHLAMSVSVTQRRHAYQFMIMELILRTFIWNI